MLNKLTKDRGAKIMIQINAMGDACPIPVVKTKKAIQTMTVSDVVETLVDNEVAV